MSMIEGLMDEDDSFDDGDAMSAIAEEEWITTDLILAIRRIADHYDLNSVAQVNGFISGFIQDECGILFESDASKLAKAKLVIEGL